MQFGSGDTIDVEPVAVKHDSVTWQWKEGVIITDLAATYVGYQILYRHAGEKKWKLGADIPYRQSEWQQGTVSELQPNTEYEFDLEAYRKTSNGELHLGPTSYKDWSKSTLNALTYGSTRKLWGVINITLHSKKRWLYLYLYFFKDNDTRYHLGQCTHVFTIRIVPHFTSRLELPSVLL